jgi:ABC-type glycerol-3-phosphate transport system permease component
VFYAISLSFRFLSDVFAVPPKLLPPRPTLSGYIGMLSVDIPGALRNSVFVAIGTTALSVSFAGLGAYAFARLRFRFANQLMVILLVSQMFPGSAIIVPLFRVLRELGLYNTHYGLMFVYTGFIVPFCTWMLYGYFRSIPAELEEAALIDGCSRMGALVRVVIPLALPGISATAVFAMLGAWNEFLFAVLFIQDPKLRLITPALTLFQGQYTTQVAYQAAAAVTAAVPPVVAFSLVRRYFISGLVAGAVKG